MITFIFKWLLRLFLLAVVLLVIFVLSLDTILRVVIKSRIRVMRRLMKLPRCMSGSF